MKKYSIPIRFWEVLAVPYLIFYKWFTTLELGLAQIFKQYIDYAIDFF